MRKLSPIFILITAILAVPAFAQNTNTPRIDKREVNQQKESLLA